MHRFLFSSLLAHWQQDETQQMVISVNFASVCTPLEDLNICGLHSLLLILYIHTVYLFVVVTASPGSRLCLCTFKGKHNKNPSFFFFFFFYNLHAFWSSLLFLLLHFTQHLHCRDFGQHTTEYHKPSQTRSVKLSNLKCSELRGMVNIHKLSITAIYRISQLQA